MEPSRAQLGEPRCAVQMAAPHRLLAGRVQQHRRGLRGGMTARPIFSHCVCSSVGRAPDCGSGGASSILVRHPIHRLRRVTPRVADGTFAAGSRVAETRSNRLRGGTAGIFYTRRDSQPPALNKPGEGERSSVPANRRAASLAAPRLPRRRGADQHVRVAPTSYTACPRPDPSPHLLLAALLRDSANRAGCAHLSSLTLVPR